MQEYLIIYKKGNGNIIERKRSTLPEHEVGEYTSMGWKILDIKYLFNDEVYNTYNEYRNAIKKFYKYDYIKRKISRSIKKNVWKLMFILYSILSFTVLLVKH